jgi:hypothetical protein
MFEAGPPLLRCAGPAPGRNNAIRRYVPTRRSTPCASSQRIAFMPRPDPATGQPRSCADQTRFRTDPSLFVTRHGQPWSPPAFTDVGECMMVYPRIDSTDLDELRLLAIFGEVGSPGTSTKNRERWLLSNSAVFPTFRWTGRRCETSTRLRFTKYGQEPRLGSSAFLVT